MPQYRIIPAKTNKINAATIAPTTMLKIPASKLPVVATIVPGISEPPTPPNNIDKPLYNPVPAPILSAGNLGYGDKILISCLHTLQFTRNIRFQLSQPRQFRTLINFMRFLLGD